MTGSSSGIGRSIAKAFAAAGASVAAVARREADLLTLMNEIKDSNGTAIPIVADVAAKGAAQRIVSQVEQQLGSIDILVNNAGIARISPLDAEDEDLDIWWRVHEVNVCAPVAVIRAVLPSMLKRNTGTLITTSSSVVSMALPVMTAYASSKAAISKFHESLAQELQGTNILSFAVNPGMVKTQLGQNDSGVNQQAMDHPAMQQFMAHIQEGTQKTHEPSLCADVMVALAADERYRVLTGCHLDATMEVGPVVREAEKEDKGRIGTERLYLVNVGTL